MTDFDIVVSGGGIVGAATALACQLKGLRTLLIEKKPESRPTTKFGMDVRTVALSPRSIQWLDHLQLSGTFESQPISEMYVWEQRGTAKIHFDGQAIGQKILAWNVEHSSLAQTIRNRCEKQLTVWDDDKIVALDDEGPSITTVANGRISCKLLVIAEGANSSTRDLTGVSWMTKNIDQRAVATLVETSKEHQGIAYQRFALGILALLPMQKPHIRSVVWSIPNSKFEAISKDNDQDFMSRLEEECEKICGDIVAVDNRLSFPISESMASTFLPKHWIAIVGDTGHTVHPLAGQGVNIGLNDAQTLVDNLAPENMNQLRLHSYARRQQTSALFMQHCMSLFNLIWSQTHPVARWLRNEGVRIFNTTPILKHQAIREAMGFGPITHIQ